MRQTCSPLGSQILWIISALILCVVVPLLLHDATGGWNNSRNPWWSLVIIVISGGAYASVLGSRRRQLFAMVLWLFTYIFMGLAPYVQYRLDAKLSTIPHIDESLYTVAGVLVIACCLAVLVGSFLAGQLGGPARALASVVVDRRRANILSVVGVLLFLYYGQQVGFSSFLLSRIELGAIRAATWPNTATMMLLTGGSQMILLVAFLAQMAVRQQRKAAGIAPQVLPALITGAVLLYAVNPISSARYVLGTVILAMVATLGAYSTLTRFRVVAVSAMFGMLVVFPLADTFRLSTDASLEIEGPVAAMATGDFDAFAQLVNTLSYVDAQGLTWGWQLLGVLLFWVPRSIWPGKPMDTGTVVAEYMGYKFTNLSSPMWAELFINFGWVGTILGMGVLGYWFRSMDRATDAYLRIRPIPPIVACAVTFYLLILLRGSLLNAASYLLVILLASWFVTRKRRRPQRGSRRFTAHPVLESSGGESAGVVHDDPVAGSVR